MGYHPQFTRNPGISPSRTGLSSFLYLFFIFGFQIKIIAQVGQVGYSDIAIDDVYIDPGLCCKYNPLNLLMSVSRKIEKHNCEMFLDWAQSIECENVLMPVLIYQ